MKLRLSILLSLALLCGGAYAASKDQLSFNANDGQHWYLLHNKGKQTVWLNAVIKNPSASAGWSSKIDAKQYSLLALNQKQLQLACGVSAENAFQPIACSKMVSLKEVKATVKDPSMNSSYWAVENTSLPTLKSKAAERGIELK